MKPFFTLLFLLTVCLLGAQKVQRTGAEFQYGFIIPHSNDLRMFADRRPVSMHLSWQSMNMVRKYWEMCNCFHYLGARLSFFDFGDQDILGNAWSLTGTFKPILWQTGRWSLDLNSGMGVTYHTQIYDEKTNPNNFFFSSRISFLLFVAPLIEYKFSKNWGAYLSLNYNHISNGGQQMPNHGMNFPQAGFGLNHYLKSDPFPEYRKQAPDYRWRFWLETGITTSRVDTVKVKRPAFSLVAGAQHPFSPVNALSGGVELSWDLSLPETPERNSKTTLVPFLAHHFLLGRVDFSQRMAWYAIKPRFYSQYNFYQRYVLFYNLRGGFHVGVSLKAHAHVAQNIDIRIGWKF